MGHITTKKNPTILFGEAHTISIQNDLHDCKSGILVLTGTEKVSSIWNSGGLLCCELSLVVSRFMNIFSKSRFSPVTLEI